MAPSSVYFTKEVKYMYFIFSLTGHHHNCASPAAGFLSKPARSMSLTLGVSRDSSCSSGVDSCRSESNNRQQHQQQQLSYGGHQRFASGNAPGTDFRRTASGACLASASSGGSGSHSCFCHSPLHGSHHGQVWSLNEYNPLSPLHLFCSKKT